jgi:hypothetical protein
MRDPHVVSLTYKLTTQGGLLFGKPPPLDYSTPAFNVHLEDGVATIEMLDHYGSEAEARNAVELFLRMVEVSATLEFRDGTMHFEFVDSKSIDRDPPPPGSVSVVVGTMRLELRGLQASIHANVSRNKYPDMIAGFVVTPDVETLLGRYQGYRQGREPLASMAYACLTLVQARAGTGNPRQLGRMLGIEEAVLRKLGELTSTVGDESTARKFQAGRPARSFSSAEKEWIDAAVRALIRRVGELANDPNAMSSVVTMSQLPSLV